MEWASSHRAVSTGNGKHAEVLEMGEVGRMDAGHAPLLGRVAIARSANARKIKARIWINAKGRYGDWRELEAKSRIENVCCHEKKKQLRPYVSGKMSLSYNGCYAVL